jgi:SAM-dependent methyltransferase
MNRGYRYVPIAGAVDDESFPWFLDWQIVWVVLNADFRAGQRVLDLGGSSSLFSYYLAAKGLDVTTIDLQSQLVENADHVARRMGWKLANHVMDMSKIELTSRFEHVTSICVYEHVPVHQRASINRSIGRLLVPGGRFSITFDYKNPSRFARINNPTDVHAQFVRPSGLRLRGNKTFMDTGQRYLLHPLFHPDCPWGYKLRQVGGGRFRPWEILESKRGNDYTFGALFQEKQ